MIAFGSATIATIGRLTLALLAGAAVSRNIAPPADLLVTITPGKLLAPDSVKAGFTRIRFHIAGATSHNLAIFRVPENFDRAAFLTAIDSMHDAPKPAVAVGGLERPTQARDTASAVMELRPGKYLVLCLARDNAGHRHAASGELQLLRVTGMSVPAVAPVATAEISLQDFAFTISKASLAAGKQLVRITNAGSHDHMVIVEKLHAGVGVLAWAQDTTGSKSDYVGGTTRISPGQTIYLELSLSVGQYGLVCLITDGKSGRAHAELGMLKQVAVVK